MDKDSLIAEINRYCSPYSLLVITPKRLLRVYCPFKVMVIYPVRNLKEGDTARVSKVMISKELYLVYVIDGKGYYHYYFAILLT